MAVWHKKGERGQIGGGVDDFGGGIGGEKVVAEQAHEYEGEQAACSRPEDAVVKANQRAEKPAPPHFAAVECALAHGLPEVFFGEGVDAHGHHNHEHHRFHVFGGKQRHGFGAEIRSGKRQCRCRQEHFPRHADFAHVLPSGGEGAGKRGHFTHAQHGGNGGVLRQNIKQSRHLQQAAAAHGGIHQTGEKADKNQKVKRGFHGVFVSALGVLGLGF